MTTGFESACFPENCKSALTTFSVVLLAKGKDRINPENSSRTTSRVESRSSLDDSLNTTTMSAATRSPKAVVGSSEPRSCSGSGLSLFIFRAYIRACVHILQAGFFGKCANLCSREAASLISRFVLAAGISSSCSESACASPGSTPGGLGPPPSGESSVGPAELDEAGTA